MKIRVIGERNSPLITRIFTKKTPIKFQLPNF